tara:strand:+ start:649 stop:1023 length:375 start_codon:yes stop_codon:yes gene_type:complete
MFEYFKLQNKLIATQLGFSLALTVIITGQLLAFDLPLIHTALSVIPMGAYSYSIVYKKSKQTSLLAYWVPVGIWSLFLLYNWMIGHESNDPIQDVISLLFKISLPSYVLTFVWVTSPWSPKNNV